MAEHNATLDILRQKTLKLRDQVEKKKFDYHATAMVNLTEGEIHEKENEKRVQPGDVVEDDPQYLVVENYSQLWDSADEKTNLSFQEVAPSTV